MSRHNNRKQKGQQKNTATTFSDVAGKRIRFGKDGKRFMLVARRVAHTEDGDRTFLSIASGYSGNDGDKFKQSVTIPDDPKMVDAVVRVLKGLME